MQQGQEWALHHSHQARYRQPFGAVCCGQTIQLALDLRTDRIEEVSSVAVRLWRHNHGESVIVMSVVRHDQDWVLYLVDLTVPEAACLLWYYFIIDLRNGDRLYYSNNDLNLGGAGRLVSSQPNSYQVTVVPAAAKTPDWWKRAVIYQIFPDRFANGSIDGSVLSPRKGSLLHANWDDNPVYVKDEKGHILAYDFFGGNLAGVRKNLPYLRDLGINVIYFNPVFSAPSNHKYDTADYHQIDPMFGTNQEFHALCDAAGEIGISVILDGVFSHTGSDSRYFNREGNYPDVGAYQSPQSPYFPWYRFLEYPDRYDCWWGVDALPNVNELEPSYRQFIISDQDSVLHHWHRHGVKGWRLDVVDELPDDFLKDFYKTLKAYDPDAILLGEVWEDASNKISYGTLREYFWGEELDSVMNYPFRQVVLDFLLHKSDVTGVHNVLMSLFENYPIHHFFSTMNLIGSHDVPRVLTLLGEATPEENISGVAERAKYRLSSEQKSLGIARLKLAVLWQMTFPGTPSVYYGDEAGVEGYRDPLNRRTYPWGHVESSLVAWHRQLIALRHKYSVLQTGDWRSLPMSEHVYGYLRTVVGQSDVFGKPATNNTALVLLNRSHKPVTLEVSVPGPIEELTDMLCGERIVSLNDGEAIINLEPFEGKLLLSNPVERRRGAGILLHPTCLPSEYGIGDLGPEAYAFVEWLAEAKQQYWQILPLCPPGLGDSPYQALSAFAGNPLLISPDLLVQDGLLTLDEINTLKSAARFSNGRVRFKSVHTYKHQLFRQAFLRFTADQDYMTFVQQESYWLEDYVLFMAIAGKYPKKAWTDWPLPLAERHPDTLAIFRSDFSEELFYQRFLQYQFFRQWTLLKQFANQRGIRVIGDLPLFVAHHSADVWARRDLFALDDQGNPKTVAGVPPDYFSSTGQLWGNPQYDWNKMKQENYRWWIERLKVQFRQADTVRIDHFRGLAAYWEIDAAAKTAMEGRWTTGPGEEFLLECCRQLPNAQLIAEDLGVITPDVDELRWRFALPGMNVLHFAFSPDHLPKDDKYTVLYTGTHDNNTTLGWLKEIRSNDPTLYREVCRLVGITDHQNDKQAAWKFVQFALSRRADTVILPLQDILVLGREARMNIPGTPVGNWSWRVSKQSLTSSAALNLASLMKQYNRENN